MIKSYKLKIYANKNKIKKLNILLSFWRDQINKKINIFWRLNSVRNSYCPPKCALGGRLKRDSSNKAWQIVKGARNSKSVKPIFKGNEIDLNQYSVQFLDFKTKEFDFWVKITYLDKYNRLVLPCKKNSIFNKALEKGKLRKSAKILKIGNIYYLQLYIKLPENIRKNNKILGIDVGLNNAVVTSNGKFYGKDLKQLRIKTKHRKYINKISPNKQKLNQISKQIIKDNLNTDFVVEKLLFKGKKNRTKKFRRNNNNWAYGHLSKKLTELGMLEGFRLIKIDPTFSSLTCPKCGFIDKKNRQESWFLCGQCGHKGHIDVIGAINLVERVFKEPYVPLSYSTSKMLYLKGG